MLELVAYSLYKQAVSHRNLIKFCPDDEFQDSMDNCRSRCFPADLECQRLVVCMCRNLKKR